MRYLILLFLLFLLFMVSPALAQQDFHYGSHKNQIVRVVSPKECEREGCPVVIWVHGGGWRNGDMTGKAGMQLLTQWAQRGIVMVGVNYRLTPEVMHPAHVQDVAAGIHWVYRNIGEHGGNNRNISLLGHSAGAHLVALVATNPDYLRAYDLAPAQVIQNVFPIDTASFDLTDNSSRFVGRLVDNAFGTDPAVLRDASPILQVQRGGEYPDFIIATVKVRADAVNTSRVLQKELQDAGASAELMIMDYPSVRQMKAHGAIAKDLLNFDSEMTKAILSKVFLEQ